MLILSLPSRPRLLGSKLHLNGNTLLLIDASHGRSSAGAHVVEEHDGGPDDGAAALAEWLEVNLARIQIHSAMQDTVVFSNDMIMTQYKHPHAHACFPHRHFQLIVQSVALATSSS